MKPNMDLSIIQKLKWLSESDLTLKEWIIILSKMIKRWITG